VSRARVRTKLSGEIAADCAGGPTARSDLPVATAKVRFGNDRRAAGDTHVGERADWGGKHGARGARLNAKLGLAHEIEANVDVANDDFPRFERADFDDDCVRREC
jgi:hypothetical protein